LLSESSSIKTQETTKGIARLTRAVKFIKTIESFKNKSVQKPAPKQINRRGAFIQVSQVKQYIV